jgi:transcriptional regulator with XRE-family HTH domain
MSRSQKHPALGPLIESILNEKGMSKATLSRRIGTSRQNISLILKKNHFDTELLWRISEVLETDLFHFVSLAFARGLPENGTIYATGKMEIRLELGDAQMVQLTVDLVRRVMEAHP